MASVSLGDHWYYCSHAARVGNRFWVWTIRWDRRVSWLWLWAHSTEDHGRACCGFERVSSGSDSFLARQRPVPRAALAVHRSS